MGISPWKNKVQLWEEKTGKKEPKDISDKPNVIYGKKMEPILREAFAVKNPKYEVIHNEYEIIKHPKYPFLFASLDGQLVDKETGEMGILEIKTTTILQSSHKETWKNGIPLTYLYQVLHYLNVTGFTFAKLFAELKYKEDYQAIRTYDIDRKDFENTIKDLEQKEIKFWKNYVEKDIRPPLELPNI